MNFVKLPLIVLALTGLIALGGCGSSSDSTSSDSTSVSTDSSTTTESTTTDSTAASGDYSQQIQTILTDFGSSFQSLGTKLQGASSAADVTGGIQDLESQAQDTIDQLNQLEPPPEAQQGQDQLVAAFEGLDSTLSDLSNVDPSDPQAAKDAISKFGAAAQKFQSDFTAATQSLTDAGVGPAAGAGG